jgi:hypothetical protein
MRIATFGYAARPAMSGASLPAAKFQSVPDMTRSGYALWMTVLGYTGNAAE